MRFCRKSPAVGSMERQSPLGSRMETPEKARVAVASRRWACAATEGWRVPPWETGTGVVGLAVGMAGPQVVVEDLVLDLVLAWALAVDVVALVFAPALVVEVAREDVVTLVFAVAVVAVCLVDVPLVFAAALVEVELVLFDMVLVDLVFAPALAVVKLEVVALVLVPVALPTGFVDFDFVLVVALVVPATLLTLDEVVPWAGTAAEEAAARVRLVVHVVLEEPRAVAVFAAALVVVAARAVAVVVPPLDAPFPAPPAGTPPMVNS